MSVRRLAEDTVQPQSFAFNRQKSAEAKVWIKKYPKGREQSAVIPLLMLAQEQDGWVTRAAIEHIAEMLEMPKIRVMEVATFYTQFQLQPVGTRAHVQVCGTTPCMLRGAEELKKVCQRKIDEQQFHRNADGTLSWEEVECQGACVNAPMVMIGRDTYEDLTPERLEEIIDAFEAGNGDTITPGPQIDRHFSAPVGGPVTLLDDPAVKKSVKAKAAPKAKAAASKAVTAKATKTKSASTKPAPAAANEKAPAKKAAAPKKPAAKKATEKKAAASAAPVKLMADKPAAKKTAAKATKAKAEAPAAKASLTDKNRPAAMKKPAKPDDLEMIAGIGPKINSTLNELGIWKWEQIAAWKKAERDWVNGYLSFKGRIEREDWVKQAKALAKGGRDEYVKVFGKEPR